MDMTDKQNAQGMGPGMFGGPGPVLGGSAGGQDYSLASMLGRSTPHDTAAGHGCEEQAGGGGASKGAGRQDRLGDSEMSAGAQDLLHGAGLLQGSGSGKAASQGHGPTIAQGASGAEELVSGKEGLSATQETTLQGLHLMRGGDRFREQAGQDARHAPDGVPAAGQGQAPATAGEGGNAKALPGKMADAKPAPDVVPPRRSEGKNVDAGADEGTKGWSAEGAASKIGKAQDLSGEEASMLRGQGIMPAGAPKHTTADEDGDYPSDPGQDTITSSGNTGGQRGAAPPPPPPGTQAFGEPVPAQRPAAQEAADNERDELREEQTEVPEEAFEQQPRAGGGALKEGAQAAWDAAAQVADKAKGLLGAGQGSKEE